MSLIRDILDALDERTIAEQVGRTHDEARMGFALAGNTVDSFPAFSRLIGEYYNHHFTRCVSRGGRLSASEAEQRAKEILEKNYRKQGGDIVMAFNDAHDGTNGGLRVILDQIAEDLKTEAVERYIRSVFDRYVLPNSWKDQVDVVREFMAQSGFLLGRSIDAATPERYARDHQTLIRAYVDGLRQTSRVFRRL
ncbi:MAG: hypothetical protein HY735_13050 [Verrucomicrobia bacterium]|nr:hypothetical protein [Verrucomicrobiota bacterium]